MREHTRHFYLTGEHSFAPSTLMLDNCEGAYDWVTTGTGADFVGEYSADHAFVGTKSLKVATRATNPAANDYVTISRKVSGGVSGLFVFRMRWFSVAEEFCNRLAVTFQYTKNSLVKQYGILIDPGNNVLKIQTAANTWVEETGIDLVHLSRMWSLLEVQLDDATGKFLKVRVGHSEVDDPTLGAWSSVGASGDAVQISIELQTNDSETLTYYYDTIYAGDTVGI